MNKKKILLGVLGAVLVLGAAGGAYYYYGGELGTGKSGGAMGDKRGGNRPTVVSTAVAKTGDMEVIVSAIGTITAKNTVIVKPRVDGQLTRVNFREGQMVKAGEVLAEIDPRPFQVVLDQASGQLTRDQAQLTNAVIDQQRYQMLLAKDSVSRQQLDTQDALVRQYQGAVQSDRAQVDSAKLQLSFTRITAPVAGRLGLRQVDLGNMVRASDATGLVVITQTQPIAAVFAIPADQLSAVLARTQAGESLSVEAMDRDGKQKLAVGKLASIDNQIDTATGTVKLKAEFENAKNTLFPNQFVNVRLKVETRKDTVLIPTAAIQRGTQGIYVYVVNAEEKTVSLRPLTLGPSTAENVVVEKGLAAGEIVVVDGADKLRQGAKIETIQPGGPRGEGNGKAGATRPPEAAAKGEVKAEGKVEKAAAPAAAASAALTGAASAAPVPAAGAPATASAAGPKSERPEWFDRLPTEVKEKVKNMAPEERREYLRAYMQKKREERERQATAE